MLDKRRIRMMTRLAIYEQSNAAEDMKISGYYKRDYSVLHTLVGAIWMSIGYAVMAVLAVFCNIDTLLESLSIEKMFFFAGAAVVLYLLMLIVYCICANMFYKSKHTAAKQRMKRFYRNLTRLQRIEKKGREVKENRES